MKIADSFPGSSSTGRILEDLMEDQKNPKISAQKQETVGVFSRGAATYGQVGPPFFSHFGRRLVELAQIPDGARILDIATGRGAVLFPAAEAVGSQGHVTGIDLSQEMVEETSREVERRALENVKVRNMDAEYLEFPDGSFDFVFCSFAIFFFPQLEQALSEMIRVLKPGGRLAVSTWGPVDQRAKWFRDLVESYLASDEPDKKQGSDPQSKREPTFNTPDGLKSILTSAGFTGIEILSESKEFTYTDENEFWVALWSHGARRNLEAIEKKLGRDGLQRFHAEASQHLKTIQPTGGITESFSALFGFAHRP
jgi:ubiquinone/menaquinone biosynthesis C-methylase UbiE